MLNRKKLVKVSCSPGKTRLINFYRINEEVMLVDLPGYGYAAVSKSEKARWGKMIEDYLGNRENLAIVVLLVDIRHAPTQDDIIMYDFLKYHRESVTIVATKMDKITKTSLKKNLDIIKRTLGADERDIIIPYSSETHQGRDILWDVLMNTIKEPGNNQEDI
jgi:GTP-binding protein